MKWRRGAAFLLDLLAHVFALWAVFFILETIYPGVFLFIQSLFDSLFSQLNVQALLPVHPAVVLIGIAVKMVSERIFPQTIGASLCGLRVHVRHPTKHLLIKYLVVVAWFAFVAILFLLQLIGLPAETLLETMPYFGYPLIGLKTVMLILGVMVVVHGFVAILVGQRPAGDYLTDSRVQYVGFDRGVAKLPAFLKHYILGTIFVATSLAFFEAALTKLALFISAYYTSAAFLLSYQWAILAVIAIGLMWVYRSLMS